MSVLVPVAAITKCHRLEIYPFTVLVAKRLKSVSQGCDQGVGRAVLSLRPLEENASLAFSSSQWLPAVLEWLPHDPVSVPRLTRPLLFCVHLCLSYKDT